MDPVHVVVAVDHPRIRASLCEFLRAGESVEVVAEVGTSLEAQQAVRFLDPDLLVMDLEMPRLDSFDAVKAVRQNPHPPRILVLGLENSLRFVNEVLQMGADGYVLKDEAQDSLLHAVRYLMQGGTGWVRRDRVIQMRPSRGHSNQLVSRPASL